MPPQHLYGDLESSLLWLWPSGEGSALCGRWGGALSLGWAPGLGMQTQWVVRPRILLPCLEIFWRVFGVGWGGAPPPWCLDRGHLGTGPCGQGGVASERGSDAEAGREAGREVGALQAPARTRNRKRHRGGAGSEGCAHRASRPEAEQQEGPQVCIFRSRWGSVENVKASSSALCRFVLSRENLGNSTSHLASHG